MLRPYQLVPLTLFISFTLQAQQSSVATEQSMLVTATKQSRYSASSQNVASWQVSRTRLEEANVTNSKDLYKVLPGLNINGDHIMFPITSLRGISSAQDFYNLAVTLYIDGIPQPSVGLIQPLGDIESMEILKGPQGTLYGKAAEGGVINIVTQQPNGDYKGYISAGYSSRNSYRAKANISGALIDGMLYGSLFGVHDLQNGQLINLSTGHHHLGDSRDTIGTARLKLAPDNQPWEVNASYSAECTIGSHGISVPFSDLHSHIAVLHSSSPDPYMRRCLQNQVISGKYTTDKWLFTAVSSWEQIHIERTKPAPGKATYTLYPENWWQDVQEIRASTQGADNPLDGIFGLYRQNVRQNKGVTSLYNADNSVAVPKTNSYTQMESIAAYTDITWHITRNADLGAGIRVSHDSSYTFFDTKAKKIVSGNVNRNHVLGQISAGYQITPQDRVYVRIAQGYKPTGFDFTPNTGAASPEPYKPEDSINYEIGNKYQSDLLNIQGALFYGNVHDLQMYAQNDDGLSVLKNMGNTRITGLELAGDITPAPGFVIGASANFINSKFTNSSKNGSYALKRVPFVPDYTGTLYLSGVMNTKIGSFIPYAALNVSGSYTFSDKPTTQQAYTTTDLHLGWQVTERINLSAYIDNIFDKRVASYIFTRDNSAFVNRGRTVGLDVKVDLF